MKGTLTCSFLLWLCLTFGLQAQGDTRDSTDIEILEEGGRDSTTIVDNMFFDIFYGKPGRAALYGLLIPGGGQIYNRRWWKLPFVYAVEGGLIWWIYTSDKNYRGFQKAYLNNLNNVNEPDYMEEDFLGVTQVPLLLSNRNKFRKQREYSYIFFIGGHLITIFEAFIDRHLMDFDTSDDLTIGPVSTGLGVLPGITYTIPISGKRPRPVPVVD